MKKKLSLQDLTVQSFVTSADSLIEKKIVGGGESDLCPSGHSCYQYQTCWCIDVSAVLRICDATELPCATTRP